MKIILTESQLKLLRIISENEDVVNNFRTKLNTITKELNKLYTTINFVSVAELLGGEVNIDAYMKKSEDLDSSNFELDRAITKYFNTFDEAFYDENLEPIHSELEAIYYKNSDKLNVISSILMNLEDLVKGNEDTKKVFSDIESINLS